MRRWFAAALLGWRRAELLTLPTSSFLQVLAEKDSRCGPWRLLGSSTLCLEFWFGSHRNGPFELGTAREAALQKRFFHLAILRSPPRSSFGLLEATAASDQFHSSRLKRHHSAYGWCGECWQSLLPRLCCEQSLGWALSYFWISLSSIPPQRSSY